MPFEKRVEWWRSLACNCSDCERFEMILIVDSSPRADSEVGKKLFLSRLRVPTLVRSKCTMGSFDCWGVGFFFSRRFQFNPATSSTCYTVWNQFHRGNRLLYRAKRKMIFHKIEAAYVKNSLKLFSIEFCESKWQPTYQNSFYCDTTSLLVVPEESHWRLHVCCHSSVAV